MLPGLLALVFLGVCATAVAAVWAIMAVGWLATVIWKATVLALRCLASRQRERAALHRAQFEIRADMLDLADALGAEAHEVRKAMIRESFLASGQLPPGPSHRA